MELNKFEREIIIDKIKKLTEEKTSKINLKNIFYKDNLKPAIIKFTAAQNLTKSDPDKYKKLRTNKESASSLVTSCDIEIELITDNINRLEEIIIANKF